MLRHLLIYRSHLISTPGDHLHHLNHVCIGNFFAVIKHTSNLIIDPYILPAAILPVVLFAHQRDVF